MNELLDWHRWIGWFMIGSNAAVGVWALAAHRWPRLAHRAIWWATGVAQLSTFAIAIVGVLLVNRYDLELDQFHALYGFSAIVAVAILYSYRNSPFMRGKELLLYGFGSLFIMGLGIRALFI
jgi:4-hydroxybenzoate polyprenyltransferase